MDICIELLDHGAQIEHRDMVSIILIGRDGRYYSHQYLVNITFIKYLIHITF